jgi:hypothetical protein
MRFDAVTTDRQVAPDLAPQAPPGADVHRLDFEIAGAPVSARIDTLIVAGWTGRDLAAVEEHIAELAALGVRRPATVPCFYRLGANLLSLAPAIEVAGWHSSGEVEAVLLSLANGLHLGVGSDHTDRKVEAYGVTVSKQMCPKPLGRELWPFRDVEPHWDDLILRSWVTRQGTRELYQEGRLGKILGAHDLMARYLGRPGDLPVGTAMYCGTLAVIGALGGGETFEIELEDPILKRRLRHAYVARCLEMAD